MSFVYWLFRSADVVNIVIIGDAGMKEMHRDRFRVLDAVAGGVMAGDVVAHSGHVIRALPAI